MLSQMPCLWHSFQRQTQKMINITFKDEYDELYSSLRRRWVMKSSRYGIPHRPGRYCCLLLLNVSKQTAYESIQMKPGAVKAEPSILCLCRVFYGRKPSFHSDSPFIDSLPAHRGNEAPQQKYTQNATAHLLRACQCVCVCVCVFTCTHIHTDAHIQR